MSRIIKAGATSQSVYLEILDSTSTTGARKTGLAFNTSSLTAYYARNGAAAVAITLATQTASGAWSSGGFAEVSSANMPGVYRLDVPDAALAAGVPSVTITVKGATGMVQVSLDIQLTAADLQDSVRAGLTALPNAAAEAAGGLYTRGAGAGQINQDANGRIDVNGKAWAGGAIPAPNVTGVPLVDTKYLLGTIFATPATSGILDVNVKNINNIAATPITTIKAVQGLAVDGVVPTVTTVTNQLTAAQIATGIWQDTTAGDFTVANSVGKSIMNGVALGTGLTIAAVSGAVGSVTGAVGSIAGITFPTNFASLAIDTTGRVNAFLIGILTTVFTEGATGRIAAAFKQFFNIATPAATMDHGVLVDTVTTTTTATNLTTNNDKTGYALSTAGILAIWHQLTSAIITAGTIGKLIIDFLDVAVSSRLASGSYTVPPTVVAIRTEMDTNSTKLANLDATISSRTKPSDTQAAVTLVTTTTNLTTNNDKTGYALTAAYDPAKTASQAGDAMTLTAGERTSIAAAVWNALTSGMTTVGSIGKKLADWVIGTTQTGDSFARLGAPAGASVSADIAAVKVDTAAIKAKTDQFVFTNANKVDATAITVSDKTGYALTSAYDPAKTAAQAGDAMALTSGERTSLAAVIWNSLTSGMTTAGSIGKKLADWVVGTLTTGERTAIANEVENQIIDDTDSEKVLQAITDKIASVNPDLGSLSLAAIATAVRDKALAGAAAGSLGEAIANTQTSVAALNDISALDVENAVWDAVLTDHLDAGTTGEALNAAESAGDPWATALPGTYGPGTAGKIIGDNINATISSRATQTSVDAVKAKTDNLPASPAAAGDCITAFGVRTAIGLSAANLDTQLDALPTNAELAIALAGADDATLAAIGALNNLSAAQAATAAAAALAAYDGPTRAEATSDKDEIIAEIDTNRTLILDLPTNAELATALAGITVPTAIENADALLTRDMGLVSGEADRSPLNAFRFIRNRFDTAVSPGEVTVYKEDDTTVAFTKTLDTDPAAEPITRG